MFFEAVKVGCRAQAVKLFDADVVRGAVGAPTAGCSKAGGKDQSLCNEC